MQRNKIGLAQQLFQTDYGDLVLRDEGRVRVTLTGQYRHAQTSGAPRNRAANAAEPNQTQSAAGHTRQCCPRPLAGTDCAVLRGQAACQCQLRGYGSDPAITASYPLSARISSAGWKRSVARSTTWQSNPLACSMSK